MTLILSAVTHFHAFQVSDRLLTREVRQRGGVNYQRFDEKSNKSVVYRGRDALVSITYTGRAFLEHVPTDQWIAQQLTGIQYGSQVGIAFWGGHRRLDLHSTMLMLRDRLQDVYSHLPPQDQMMLSLMVVGWQRVRRNAHRPVMWAIERDQRDPRVFNLNKKAVPRRGLDHRFWLQIAPDMSTEDILALRSRLRSEAQRSPEVFEAILADCIRAQSLMSPVIGPHVMCIQITDPAVRPQVRIRYVPAAESGRPTAEHSDGAMPAAYAPWVLAYPTAFPPAIVAGKSGGWVTDDFEWRTDTPAPPSGSRVFVSVHSQHRPRDPQRGP